MPSPHHTGAGRERRAVLARAYCAWLCLLLVAVACAPAGRAQEQPPDAVVTEMLRRVNHARSTPRECGDTSFAAAGPLRLHVRLSAAAQLHSEDMRRMETLSHVGSDGSDFVKRAERQGYDWSKLAENVAYGYEEVAAVVDGWLGSPGHCRNIMNPDFTEMGVGVAGVYWTQVFGTPR